MLFRVNGQNMLIGIHRRPANLNKLGRSLLKDSDSSFSCTLFALSDFILFVFLNGFYVQKNGLYDIWTWCLLELLAENKNPTFKIVSVKEVTLYTNLCSTLTDTISTDEHLFATTQLQLGWINQKVSILLRKKFYVEQMK